MFNIVMGAIVGVDVFLGAQAMIEYTSSNDWRHAVGSIAFLSLAAWTLIRAVRMEQ